MTASKNMGQQTKEKVALGGPRVEGAVEKVAENIMEKGMFLKDAMGLSGEMVEAIYSFAYHLYSIGKYEEAMQIFRLLIMLDPLQPRFPLGLAACFHMLKDYHCAASSYMLCTLLDGNDPLPHYHAADCYTELKQPEIAADQLRICIAKCGNVEEFQPIKARAEVTLAGFTNRLPEENAG